MFSVPARHMSLAASASVLLAGVAMSIPATASAQFAKVSGNDLAHCEAGKGPAVKVRITDLRSSQGNVFVRLYRARAGDWLKSKRYLLRVDTAPRTGAMTVCVPVPAAGRYAIAVQHDINGNREIDFSRDGVAMSNNPSVGSFLGIPRAPAVDRAAFSAGTGITPITVRMRYRD